MDALLLDAAGTLGYQKDGRVGNAVQRTEKVGR